LTIALVTGASAGFADSCEAFGDNRFNIINVPYRSGLSD
jgi:NADP-dependent 3-hydroxy acid dehydrogenase YdfG